MCWGRNKPLFQVNQGENKDEKRKGIIKLTFNIVFQLLPVGFMFSLQFLTKVHFELIEYISNILIFIVMTSIANIVSLHEKEHEIIKNLLGITLCFALLFYTLVLINDSVDLELKINAMMVISVFLFVFLALILFYQEAEGNKKS